MGKQSARLYYQGKDHKDIYFQGNYHRAMYKGDELVWMKIGGKFYAPTVRRNRSRGVYELYLYYPESKSVEKLMELEGYRSLNFNGTFLYTSELEFISKDGKKNLSENHGEYDVGSPAIGGCIGSAIPYRGSYWYSFDDNGNIKGGNELPNKPLDYDGYVPATDYYRNYAFLRRPHRYILGIIRKDGYQFPDVTFRGGTISLYVYLKGKHILIVAYNGYLYIYQSKDLVSWQYHGTTIKTTIDNSDSDSYYKLSCIYDGEKYLLYVWEREGSRKDRLLLYETNDFESFENVSLEPYIKIRGMKEDSVYWLVTDEETFYADSPNKPGETAGFIQPYSIKCVNTLLYNDGIRMNPQSIFTGAIYIDNLYLRSSENNMLIDFWED